MTICGVPDFDSIDGRNAGAVRLGERGGWRQPLPRMLGLREALLRQDAKEPDQKNDSEIRDLAGPSHVLRNPVNLSRIGSNRGQTKSCQGQKALRGTLQILHSALADRAYDGQQVVVRNLPVGEEAVDGILLVPKYAEDGFQPGYQ